MLIAYATAFNTVSSNTRAQFMESWGIVLVDAWILFKSVNKCKTKYRNFLLALAKELAGLGGSHRVKSRRNSSSPTTGQNSSSPTMMGTECLHLPVSGDKRGTCQYCKEQGDKSTGNCIVFCSGCKTEEGRPVFANHKNCSAKFHKLQV